jgi:ribosomal RNA assembly protein
MSFTQVIKVPRDRIGVLIGKGGKVKEMIEQEFNVRLDIDGESGDVRVSMNPNSSLEDTRVFKAIEFINAIARGFSPERAKRLLATDEDTMLNIIDIKDYVGRSHNSLERVKGRIIGKDGKARRMIEELTNTYISVHGHYVSIIGKPEDVKLASDAVMMLITGSMHSTVYKMLEKARRKAKLERLKLWEDKL